MLDSVVTVCLTCGCTLSYSEVQCLIDISWQVIVDSSMRPSLQMTILANMIGTGSPSNTDNEFSCSNAS